MPTIHLIGAATLMLASTASLAGSSAYQCEISEQLHLGGDGSLKQPPSPWLIGSRFSVDRDTGALVGPDHSLWGFPNSKSTVIARGNAQSSFVVLITTPACGDGVTATTIHVEEFVKGGAKPFVASKGTQVASGTCE
jgi:hypothetical protein